MEFQVSREVNPNPGKKCPGRSECSYKDVWFNLYVDVDEDVLLTGLDFLGPSKKDMANYEILVVVKTEVEEPSYILGFIPSPLGPLYWYPEVMPQCKGNVKGVKKGTNINFSLPNPVLLEKGKPYIIRFQLNGPETEQMKATERTIEVETEKKIVKWTVTGTRQIPNLYFKAV